MTTDILLTAIGDRSNKRDQIAALYREALSDYSINFSLVNSAILDRWSMSGLIYIKTKAWKLAEAVPQ